MAIEWNQEMITGMLTKMAAQMSDTLNGEDSPPRYLFALIVMENLVHDAGTAIVSNVDHIESLAGMLAEQAITLHNRDANHEVIELNARH